MKTQNIDNMKRIRELEKQYIEQQIMYQEWFKDIKDELKELRAYLQKDGADIDTLIRAVNSLGEKN